MNRTVFESKVNETIAALASAPGPSPRGILRISGANAIEVAQKILGEENLEFHTRQARRYPCSLKINQGKLRLSASIFVWPTGRSFTGEQLVEIHTIGSPPLLNELLEELLTNGARPAEKGEFTLRAFQAGRIDLVQAEAVLGVIDARSQDQLQMALDQLAGGISTEMVQIREDLLLHLADLEAGLDFVEEDIDFVQRDEFLTRLTAAESFLSRLIQQGVNRFQSSSSYRVVLAGLPNAGKSTLFNALLDNNAAIVSPVAGTTRDYLAAEIAEANGLRYQLVDTAGWETARDGIEEVASQKRIEQYQQADVIIWCSAADMSDSEKSLDHTYYQSCAENHSNVIQIQTKADLSKINEESSSTISVTTTETETVNALRLQMSQLITNLASDTELIGSTAARCQESLTHALESIRRAQELVDLSAGDELVSMELRDVLEHLGRIVGAVYTDDILDRIFSRFCIGK